MRPIDADALVASLEESYKELRTICHATQDEVRKQIYEGELLTFLEAILRTKGMPTLDLAPVVHGEWLPLEEPQWNCFGLITIGFRCSECGREVPHNDEPYCHCGAKMDGGKTDD